MMAQSSFGKTTVNFVFLNLVINKIMENMTIKVLYWAEQEGDKLHEPNEIREFKQKLSENYTSVVHGRPGDLGGIDELIIEVISSMSLKEVVNAMLISATYDMIKQGTKSFVLKPFMDAYKSLKDSNSDSELDIYSIQFTFEDSIIKLYKITENSIYTSIGTVFNILAKNYDSMILPDGEKPFEIFIPVFEDPDPTYANKYRLKYNVDETIVSFDLDDYTKLWGLYYDYNHCFKTYNIQKQILIDKGEFVEDGF